jgi:hypothetical protein
MRPLALATFLVLVPALSACGQDASAPTEAPGDTSPAHVSDAERASLSSIGRVSERAEEILADGLLTWAEYEQAIIAKRECMLAAGFTKERPDLQTGFWRHSEQGEDVSNAAARCNEDVIVLSWLWARHHQPSEQEVQAARTTFANCLRELAGADLPETPGRADLERFARSPESARNPQAFVQCQFRVEEEFGFPNFGG